MSAPLTGKGPLCFDSVPPGLMLALWAGVILAVANVKKMFQTCFIVREPFEELGYGKCFHG